MHIDAITASICKPSPFLRALTFAILLLPMISLPNPGRTLFLLNALAGLLMLSCARADVTLGPLFCNHAVLQKSARTPVWGKAEPGEHVQVSLDSARGEATADANGAWRVDLDLDELGPGPFELKASGKNNLTFTDILVGEVWLCSGQSNMEWTVKQAAKDEALTAQSNPNLRLFNVKSPGATEPQTALHGRKYSVNDPLTPNTWGVDSPEHASCFSAVAYFFGKNLGDKLQRPVGLINASWGGTPIESWISSEGHDSDANLKAPKDNVVAAARSYPQRFDAYLKAYEAWQAKYQRQDRPTPNAAEFTTPGISTEGWVPVTLPGTLPKDSLPAAGVFWLRRTISIDPKFAGKAMTLVPGILKDFDEVYWNGRKIGETTWRSRGASNNRTYWVPPDVVKAGEATIAIRLFTPVGNPGMDASSLPSWMSPIRLTGEWLAKAESALPALSPEALAEYPTPPVKPSDTQSVATGLFNGMINPLIPYGIRGVLWYQGETNVALGYQYRTTFPLLIRDWRAKWGQGDFPFYFCQLGGYGDKKEKPEPYNIWAETREAQFMTLSQPNTAMAVMIDLTENNVHFRNKKPAGDRLAAIALARTYGESIPYSGPLFDAMRVEGNQIRVKFRHTDGGLVARPLPDSYIPDTANPAATVPLAKLSPGSELQGFAIAGENKNWQWAQARIDGDSVLVWSDQVKNPTAVRYGWATNPTLNLYNSAGFPASPFRSDDYPAASGKAKYTGRPY